LERRTQAQRSADTQDLLLQATIDCLVERGFEGTSTPEICRRAGVSRGAQLHHYPTKVDLLVAAVEYLCDQRHAEFRQLVEKKTSKRQRLDAAFDHLWEIYSSPTLSAWMELTVAARTDPVLKAEMGRVSGRLEDEAEITLREFFGIANDVPAKASVRLVLSLLDGLAFRCILQDDRAARKSLKVFRVLVEPWLGQGGKD
jgi:AcrR family transcriptional regulator